MKEELQLVSDIYKRINISELAPRDAIKGHLRDARRMLNDLTVKLSQHDVMPSLRCIWNGKTDDTYRITIGKTYPLVYNHEHYYAILNDDGDVDTYNKSCFELVSNEV